MTAPLTEAQVTYGDLFDPANATIVDKSGNHWFVVDLDRKGDDLTLWIGGTPGARDHFLSKKVGDPVTVLRPATHAEEVAQLQEQAPGDAAVGEPYSEAEVKTLLEEGLDATVVAEESAAEHDARVTADHTGEPTPLPLFADMTRLEQQSHLYLLHGVYAADVKFGEKLVEMHDKDHADVDRRPVPHTHGADDE